MWRRSTGWSRDEEHFEFDVPTFAFVRADLEGDNSDTDRLRGSGSPKSAVEPAYLEALAEVRREVMRQPLDVWESGRVLKLYAELARLSADTEGHETSAPWGHLHDMKPTTSWLARLYEQTVHVCEAMIVRYHPNAVGAMVACVQSDAPLTVNRLNQLVRSLSLPKGSSMLAVWLSSFDRADRWDSGSSPVGDREFQRMRDFADECAVVVKHILARGGPAIRQATLELTRSGTE